MALQAVIVLQRSHNCAVEALVHVEFLDVLYMQALQVLRFVLGGKDAVKA